MKELKFRSLENLNVPDELMDRLLAIPETESEKPPVPLWRRPRFIAMAASLVLVTALSLALFLNMGSSSPVPVKSSSTEIVWSTDEHGATVATEIVVVPNDPDRQDITQSAEKKSPTAQFFERPPGGDDTTSPTTPTTGSTPSGRGRTSPAAMPGATEGGKTSPSEGDSPSFTPTEPSPDHPTASPQPTVAPGPHETELPTATPWYPDYPTEPQWKLPTEAPTPPRPTQSPYRTTITNTFSAFSNPYIIGDTVYCTVYGLDGTEYGDGNRFSDQHIADVTYSGGRYTASYSPCDYGILPADGKYNYEFYNSSGRVLARGTATLSA